LHRHMTAGVRCAPPHAHHAGRDGIRAACWISA